MRAGGLADSPRKENGRRVLRALDRLSGLPRDLKESGGST